jgi:TonB-linked SusC/RagA family outer membrane protein
MKKIVIALCFYGLLTIETSAQERVVTGTVKSADDNSGLVGASVTVKGTNKGTLTDIKGNYKIALPEGRNILVFKYVGYKTQEITVKDNLSVEVTLETDAKQATEVIVTGVAEGTSTKLLGFAVGKIDEKTLKEVPGQDAANAIRGKVSGVQIVQPTGVPGTAPEIRLRGVTNIQGVSQPLIVVDGVLLPAGTNLADINMNDAVSVEIVKGAAAASIYGTQAANGVVQIITKRGSDTPGKTDYTYRSEVGATGLQKEFPVNNSHRWRLTPEGDFFDGNAATPGVLRVFENDQYFDNPYPAGARNQQRELYKPFATTTNYGSVASSGKNTNFSLSAEQYRMPGIVQLSPGFDRYNGRLNLDHRIDNLKLSANGFYSSSSGLQATERQQGGPFYGILLLEPDFDIYANNPDGSRFWAFPGNVPRPNGQGSAGNNAINPLYSLNQAIIQLDRNRFTGSTTASYQFFSWIRSEAQFTFDRITQFSQFGNKKLTYNGDMTVYTGGGLTATDTEEEKLVATFSTYITKNIGDLNNRLTYRYQYEYDQFSINQGFGSVFNADNNVTLQNLTASLGAFNSVQPARAESFFFNLQTDYKEKYVLEANIRRDRTSLFGAQASDQWFPRVAGAWRITEDVKIPGVQEFKVRSAFGVTGQRPPWAAQYETFLLSAGNTDRQQLGNNQLRSSRIAEWEIGTNLFFLNRFTFEFNYAKSTVTDGIINAPQPAFASGFPFRFINVGEIDNNTIEFQLGTEILNTKDWTANLNVTMSRTTNIVRRLGIPPFSTDGLFGQAGNIAISNGMFRIQEGQPLGAMFGNIHATSSDQLIVGSDGFVNNLRTAGGIDVTGLRPEDFTVNSDGYIIRRFRPTSSTVVANTVNEGSVDEIAYLLVDRDPNSSGVNQPLVTKIGDSNPDWIMGINGTISWKGLSLYCLVDFQFGGEIYNATRQLMYFNERHGDLDQSNKADGQKKTNTYYQSLYNGNNSAKHFVETGAFIWLRELNLSYTLSSELLSKTGITFIRDIKVGVIGRNLLVSTNYSGYSPEVALANNSTTFRTDQFAYPLFRSIVGTIQVRF